MQTTLLWTKVAETRLIFRFHQSALTTHQSYNPSGYTQRLLINDRGRHTWHSFFFLLILLRRCEKRLVMVEEIPAVYVGVVSVTFLCEQTRM